MQKKERLNKQSVYETSKLFWSKMQQPGQSLLQCKMESAQTRKRQNEELSHRKFTMISQKQYYLRQLKEKSFSSAKKRGALRQQLRQIIILITFWKAISQLYRSFRQSYEDRIIFEKQKLVVVKLKAKLRMILKQKCRHPACKAEKADYPVIKPEYITVLHQDRTRYSLAQSTVFMQPAFE